MIAFLEKQQNTMINTHPKIIDKEHSKHHLNAIKKMLRFLDMIPEKYKVGPWSPIAHMIVFSYICFLLLTLNYAIKSYTNQHNDIDTTAEIEWIQTYRFYGGLYGLSTSFAFLIIAGLWPFTSYTLTSWNLMTLKLVSSYLASKNIIGMNVIANIVRYPALVGCSITVVIWWFVLVPIISYCLYIDKTNPSGFSMFWKWNTSIPLINVHLINLPLIAIDFLGSRQLLTFFDLWISLLIALLYILFYLNVLDANGLHFYIILTPRTSLCVFVYAIILCIYYYLYLFWNSCVI